MPALPDLPRHVERVPPGTAVVVGHVITVLLGPTTRIYNPTLHFFELMNSNTHDRIRVDLSSDDAWFVLPLPVGSYEVTLLQIAEGAFLANAGLNSRFHVEEGLTFVGTWRLGIESPQYDREVIISVVTDNEVHIREKLAPYYSVIDQSLAFNLLSPATSETRLYEVPPYPRYWWFKRHHTS
ncbi:MAG: hypothetical protein AB7G48_07945 [Nitrospiraceae bacterium]